LINASSLVLITTASRPPAGVYVLEMTHEAKRKITAKGAVFFWAALGVKKIVIADATGQTLLDDSDVHMLKQMDVEVEQVYYLQDNSLVIQKGKGYGEGALIQFALQNSRFLKEADHFFKCTGKVYCRNFLQIFKMIEQNNIQNIFWRDVFNPAMMDTRFFYVSKKFCTESLLPAYEKIDDRNKKFSEHCVMKAAQEQLSQSKSVRPMLSGFSGSMNRPYFDSSPGWAGGAIGDGILRSEGAQGLGSLEHNFPCWISQ